MNHEETKAGDKIGREVDRKIYSRLNTYILALLSGLIMLFMALLGYLGKDIRDQMLQMNVALGTVSTRLAVVEKMGDDLKRHETRLDMGDQDIKELRAVDANMDKRVSVLEVETKK